MKNSYSFQRLALRRNKSFLKFFGLLAVMLFAGSGVTWGQTTIAAWTFPTATGNAGTSLAAECGAMQVNSNLYADGTNASDNWSGSSLVYLNGVAPSPSLCEVSTATGALTLVQLSSSNNNKSIVFKLSTTGYKDIKLSYATRGTNTGFSTHLWSYSTDGTSFTSQSNITGRTSTNFSTQNVDFSTVTTLNNKTVIYIKLTVSGASTSQANGNNRFDNFNFSATSSSSPSPTLIAASSPTVDGAFDVSFTEDASWRGAITEITVGGTTLAASAYDKTAAGKITFTPSASSLLQSAGTKAIVVKATGYTDATVSQAIGAGVAAALTMKTQPAAPSTNGAVLASQPEVNVLDQYGNITTATVVASKGDAGAWTLGGTTSVAAVSGVSTFTNLTATSAAAVTGASLTFSSGALTVNSATFDIAAPPAQIDWTNLQWPGTGTVKLGQAYDVYARVYEPGVTDAVGQGAGVQVWIGYSTSATNPNTWTNWVAATYYGDDGANNDEYKADLGAAMTATGTYYYATRVQLGTALYVYGGFNGGFWDGTTNVSGVLTVNPAETLDWVNLQAPASGNITTAQTLDVYAQVYESGLTEAGGQGAGVSAWIGYSTSNTNPNTWTNWVPASFNVQSGNNDEYKAILSGLTAGTYYYASRFKYGLADYQYGGYSSTGGNFWDGTANVSGVLTITTAEPADHVTAFTASTDAPTYSSIKLDWTDAVGASHYLIKGSAVSYEDITAPADGTAEADADGALVKNVAAGLETYTFTGLSGDTAYFFKIFPYNGTGTAVNFKTDATVPQASATTAKTPTLLLVEDFEYDNGTVLTTTATADLTTGWGAHSIAPTPNSIDVTVPGLTFNGYVGSGIGGAARVDNNGSDINKKFTPQSSGTLYAAFIISASSTNSQGYFIHLAQDNASNFIGRVWINGTGTGVGIGTDAPSTYSPISANTPTLLVVKYNFGTKVSSLYVLNSMSAIEPTTATATFTETTTTLTNVGTVCLRQYNASQNIIVDGIRVTTSWADLPVSFTGTGEWTDATRWNTGAVPGATAQVVVDGAATINSDVEVAGLTINAGKSLTVNAAKQLTISGTATNNGTITIQSDANGTGTIVGNVSGAATVNQHLSSYRTWYLSSPVSNVAPSNMDRYKFYDETTGNWSTTAPAQTIGAGFLAVPTNNAVTSTSFTGTLNNGNININVTRSVGNGSKPGFNLVGNPYPSYLDWTSVYANNNPLGSEIMPTSTMWYRTKVALETDPVTYEYKFWTVNGASGVGSPSTATKYIAPMQSFWVRAKNVGTSTLTFTNAMRKDAPAENKLLKAPAALNTGLQLLRLQVSNESANTDEAVIYFNTNASNGLDAYDSPKMSNENAAIPEIYTSVGNEQLVINGLNAIPLDQEIGLGFVAGNATSFSIKAKDVTNLPSDVKVILKDNVTKAETDLTDGTAVYSFSNIATSGDRFSIIFRTSGAITGIDQPTFSGLTAYSNANNQLTVLYDGAIDAQTVVSVYNAVGQRLVTQSLKGVSTVIDGEFAPGVYVVKVNNLSRKLTIKK